MKRNLVLLTLTMMLIAANIYAQPNIFNHNDPIVEYNSSNKPPTPPNGTMAKWVRTKNRITWWNTDKFKPYIWNGMAFRLRFPNGYNPNDNTKKYPVILFLHGAGEIQPIYDNEDQMYWGAQQFQEKIDSGQFNAFLLFPQVSNQAWDYFYYTKINSVLDSMEKYTHSDPDRLIVMGLSNGGFGSITYSQNFPQRSATIISSSPALIQLDQPYINSVIHIPFWVASGGLDDSPGPDVVNNYIDTLKARGGSTRYNFYPTLGHGTWTQMWLEPYLVPTWQTAHKANPIIFNGKNAFCPGAVTARIGITQGFAEYQWRVDNVDIPNSNRNEIIGTQLGSYQARFRRVGGGAWSDWSPNPAVIIALPPVASPPISITGIKSVVLPAPDGSTTTPLQLPTGYTSYEWRRVSDSAVVSTTRTFNAPVGQFIGKATNCSGLFTPNFNIYNANGASKPDSARNLTLTRVTTTSVRVNWSDVAAPAVNESGFEIYRAANAGGPYVMAGLVGADVKTFLDTAISDNYNFYYRVRAVSPTGAAGLSTEASLQVGGDGTAPTAPTNLQVVFTSPGFIDLAWTPSTDAFGVTAYDIYVNGTKKYTTSVPKLRADTLAPNMTYTFTVFARDQAGNVSPVSNSVSGISRANGIKYSYYEGAFTVLPNFTPLTVLQQGTSANVDLSVRPAGVNQNYAFVWEGFIRIPTAGNYTFETVSDDGSKFYYNTLYSSSATALVNNDGVHGAISATGTVNIPDTGLHAFALTFFQQASGQSVQLYWTGPGITRQLVPNSAFIGTAVLSDAAAPTAPANLSVAFSGTNSIGLTWTASTDNVGVVGYDVYVNGTKKYTTTSTAITADTLLTNTTYTFTVTARDLAGNTSVASNTLSAATTAAAGAGLNYKFYQGTWSTLPDFNALTPVKTGISSNVDISVRTAGVNDNFGFVWQGYITIATAGSYTFETVSDDGSKLYFNSLYVPTATATVNNDGLHAATSATGTVNIAAPGVYPISITYIERDGGESMQAFWTGPNFTRQLIPNGVFSTAPPATTDTIAPTVPGNLKLISVGQNQANLHWDASTDATGVVAYDIYRDGIKRYTSTTNDLLADTLVANTPYNFTVTARDATGNTSAASAQVLANTISSATANGLNYRYYEGGWDVLPNFNTLTPVKTGTTPNVDLSVRNRADSFGIVWEGFINMPSAGTYTFETVSNEGSKLYFNSIYGPAATPLVNNDGIHAVLSATGSVTVPAAGLYPIAVSYFDKTGVDSMKVLWSGPGFGRQPISNVAFTTGAPQFADSTAPSTPAAAKVITISQNMASLHWNPSTDNVGVVGYDIYRDGIKKYSTTTATDIIADSLVANTNYNFTIRARDLAGNLSVATANIPVATIGSATANGLNYRYFEAGWDALPNFNALTPVKTGVSPNIDLSVRNRADSFGIVWEGFINIPYAGSYTFETNSDEGSKFYFNSIYGPNATALVTNDSLHAVHSATGTVSVPAAGLYPIAITYFDKMDVDSMSVYWTGPSITRQLIPSAAFTAAGVVIPDTTRPTTPTNLAAGTIGSTSVNLTWTASTDNKGVVAYDIYVGGIKKYTSITNSVTADTLSPSTPYSFTVTARDLAGNTSFASTALPVTTIATQPAQAGLNYKFYQGVWSVLPNFNTLTPVKSGITPNVDISVRNAGVNDNFGFVWEGYINMPSTGSYTFETVSDDGSKLYFNSLYSPSATATVNNDGLHAATSATGTVNVTTAGYYPISITYIERDGGESMQVYWSGPGIPRQLIPNAAFSAQLPADATAPTAPTNVTASLINSTFINLTWTASTDNVGVTGYDVYLNGNKKYTTSTNSVTADTLTTGTQYTFTVKARDFAGNTSAFSNPLVVSTSSTTQGLTYKYYEGAWDVLPNFNALTPIKSGFTPNVDIISTRNQADNYGYLFEGNITLPSSGTYTFETISDDGSKLYFNTAYSAAATALVNNDGLHGPITATGTVTMPAGSYPIAITFFERASGESMQVYWTGPGIPRQLIPNAAFVYQAPVADTVAPTVPTNLSSPSANSTFINLTWTASSDNIGVASYDVYVNGAKKYNTTTNSVSATGLVAATPYTFSVKALDFAGNASAFSADFSKSTTSAPVGLSYKYYQGTWDLLPNFNALTPIKTGIAPNVDIITTRNQADNYGYLWEGSITLPTTGTYTFETISDDGSKLYFNTTYSAAATALVNNDGVHGPIAATGSVNMAAGTYPIAITFFEKNSGESMQVYWTGPGIVRQLIPDAAFAGTYTPPVDNQAPSTPANVKAILTTNTFVDIAWDASTDNIGVTGYDVYVNGNKQSTVTNTLFRLSGLSAGQSNTITIKAVDLAGNASGFSTALPVVSSPKANGLKYRYYEGDWNTLPNFDGLTAIKTGSTPTADITVRPSGVNDHFGFVWEGYINITTPGVYTFETISDDGSKFYWNTLYNPAATALVNNDGLHGGISVTGSVNIPTAGLYPISITYFEKDGGETMQVWYSGPGITRQQLPGSAVSFADGGTATQRSTSLASIDGTTDPAFDAKVATAFPNPFTDNLKIQYSTTTEANHVSVAVYDMAGRQVQRQLFGKTSAGPNTLNINLDKQMLPGLYLIKLDVDGKTLKMWKMVKARK